MSVMGPAKNKYIFTNSTIIKSVMKFVVHINIA